MTLYIRLLMIFARSWFGPQKQWSVASVLHFRVLPFDCDINLHLTSSRYMGFADLGRFHLLGQMGILQPVIKRRWFPFLNGFEISFIRPIAPLQKFTIKTRILTWDDKYWYTKHGFEVGGQVRAIALARGAFVKRGQVIPMEEIAGLLEENPLPPGSPETILKWRELLNLKKKENPLNRQLQRE